MKKGGWLWDCRLYHKERWYCRMCDKRTITELNPEWVADGKPFKWDDKDYGWFARCSVCRFEHYYPSYACPNCGCDIDEQEPIEITKAVLNPYYSYEFGVTGYDWEERHQCRKCRTRFWINNSNC